ncbi:dTDP-4-dehydrorhamnose 3,5-epimerase [Flavihumibacter sp. CACIAM 22H1]|uniref:dTDP-4-dehydrorhamnose 3,5-epimerase n=1 Tax=Flavihumibacter sp. CACIAM 22H1 TaxID=1812911 RepID=UPI0007A85E85|nr:dTDP-4-dehydrorhamnose 3,5-epimerase [Flavihumibacter sp. CACIAM 22H1]KYP14289.1 MAG: dTDP-4-dehydrorhamnose 3,5-epimerase [Flavihumibacter sp. CACIAM 22H1]
MAFTETGFPGLLIYEPKVFGDHRGYFFESYNAAVFAAANIHYQFIQDNQARSGYGVVRGLHYQLAPFAQTKLVRALEGRILDVVVDCRKKSPSFGKVFSIELTAENKKQLLVPKGFAHGYSVLSETAEVLYKCDALYNKEAEAGVFFKDPALAIDWKVPEEAMLISDKDKVLPLFAEVDHLFELDL